MSTSPAQFQSAHGALAPINRDEPSDQLAQERQEERINAPRLEKFLNRTLDSIAELDQNDNLKIHNVMVRCGAFYDGRFDGDVRNGVWVDNNPVDGEIIAKDNDYKKQIDKLQMEMCRSRIKYQVSPVDKSNAELREAARFAERRIEVNQNRIETWPFIQAENMSLLLKTIAFRYTFFDRNANSNEKSIEMRVMKHITEGKEIAVCRTCGMAAQAVPCPHCGDTETISVASPPSEGMKVEQEQKPAGRPVTVRPDATMVQLDLNARDIPGSSFIRWRLVLRRCDWESMFPDTHIPSSDESTESRHRSEAQSNPSNSGWDSSSDVGGGDQFEKIEGELVWLDSKVYQRYENKESETLKGGQILPAGEKLIDKFPDGLCVARIGKTVLDLYPSNKNKCWTMCVYGLREHALHGSGTIALLGPQETLIELNSAIRANIVYNAAGRDLVRSGAIEGGQLPSIDKVAYVNCSDDNVGDIAKWAHGKIAPSPLSGEVYSYRQEMQGSMQDSAGTFSLSNQGAADMKALGTATAVEASRDSAVGRMIPNRQLQAYMGTEWSGQVLDAERENYTPETFLGSAEKSDEKGEMEYTERGVRAFFNSDSSMFLIEPVEGSWMPTTPAQDRANATEWATIVSKVEDKETRSLLAPKFGIDSSADDWGAAQRNASMRLEEYARVAEIVSKGGYPADAEMVGVVLENIAEWARVNFLMDDHPAFREYYQDWFMSDAGRNADSLLRLVIQAVYGQHGEGIGVQAQELSAIKLKAQELEMAQQAEIAAKAAADAQAIDEKARQEAEAKEAEAKQEGIVMELGKKALEQDDAEFQSELKMAEKEHAAKTEVAKTAAMAQVAPPTQ